MFEALRISTAENGFIVQQGEGDHRGYIGKQWAFESAETLATFVEEWGQSKTKKKNVEKVEDAK